jgi:hypothetical protein
MSPKEGPIPYNVSYSQKVRTGLKALLDRAVARGMGRECLDALKALDRILRIYPQYGEPFRDLVTEGETVWVMTIPPFVVHYIIDEPNRAVIVMVEFKLLPNSGL